jgi:hypothetical protein
LHEHGLAAITTHPDSKWSEIQRLLRPDHLSATETKTIRAIWQSFQTRRQSTSQTLAYIAATTQSTLAENGLGNADPELLRNFQAQVLFFLLTQQEPSGAVDLVDFPFAVGWQIADNHDATALGEDPDVVAGYEDQQLLSNNWTQFPLITLGPAATSSSRVHEITHGENICLVEGLATTQWLPNSWGSDQRKIETVRQQTHGRSLTDERRMAVIRSLLPQIAAQAKDEIISYFQAEDQFTHGLTMLWQSQVDQHGRSIDGSSYDFFRNSLGVEPSHFRSLSRQRFNQLIDEFDELLMTNIGFLRKLWGVDHYFGTHFISKNAMLSFMRFTPLPLWHKYARYAFPGYSELLRLAPAMAERQAAWMQSIATTEGNYRRLLFDMSVSSDGMGYVSFRSTTQPNNGGEIRRLSADGERLCQKIDRQCTNLDTAISHMKDCSLRYDLFDEADLQRQDNRVRRRLYALHRSLRQLMPIAEATLVQTR